MSIQPLSAYNICHDVQQSIADVLNQSPVLLSANIEVLAENRLDVDFQIKESLNKQGLAAIVMTPTLEYIGHTGESEAYQMSDLTLQVVEYTPLNRASNRQVVCTGLDICNYASELLAGPHSVIGFGKLNTVKIEQGEEDGLLVTKLILKTTTINDQGSIIYVPFVTRPEMEEYVGDGKLTFTQGGEEIGQFSANSKDDIEIEIPVGAGAWGQITGEIDDQQDLIDKLDEKASQSDFEDLQNSVELIGNDVTKHTNEINALSATIDEVQSDVSELEDTVESHSTSISELNSKIVPVAPSTDALSTALAGAKSTAEFVNSSINNFAAFYLTKNANGDAFGTYAELSSATKFYNAGEERTPTKNDYLVVLEDETKTTTLGVAPTTRYTYQGIWPNGQWEFQYIVNNTALTQSQVDAINSGVTSSTVSQVTTNKNNVQTLQANVQTLSSTKANASDVYAKTETYSSDEVETLLDDYAKKGQLNETDILGISYNGEGIALEIEDDNPGIAVFIDEEGNKNDFNFPDKSGTFALTSDIDDLSASISTDYLKKADASNTYAKKTDVNYVYRDAGGNYHYGVPILGYTMITNYALQAIDNQLQITEIDGTTERPVAGSTNSWRFRTTINPDTGKLKGTFYVASEKYVDDNYTPLSTFNETLGDLSTIIHGI